MFIPNAFFTLNQHTAFYTITNAQPPYTNYAVVVTKSTVPVGTGREVARRIRAVAPKAEFDVVSNPEFLREGSAIHDALNPDRIVIGADGANSRVRATVGSKYAAGDFALALAVDPKAPDLMRRRPRRRDDRLVSRRRLVAIGWQGLLLALVALMVLVAACAPAAAPGRRRQNQAHAGRDGAVLL